VVSSGHFSPPAHGCDFIPRKSCGLQMIQQNRKLVYAVQSECIWKGKSPHLGAMLRVTSSWVDPDVSRTAEKGKNDPVMSRCCSRRVPGGLAAVPCRTSDQSGTVCSWKTAVKGTLCLVQSKTWRQFCHY